MCKKKKEEVNKMKRTPMNKWYLFVDGQSAKVTNSRTEIDTLNGVVIEITADEAAQILALTITKQAEREGN
jgi:hypothetical protein